MSTHIDNTASYFEIHNLIVRRFSEGKVDTAVSVAKSLTAGQGQENSVKNLQALTYADAGIRLKNVDLVGRGLSTWSELGEPVSSDDSYNRGSAHLASWQFSVAQDGFHTAWIESRSHLHEARRLFDKVAKDKEAELELRLKAFTDAGNSYDIVGRYSDAIKHYDKALRLDPTFGMALGNRGITFIDVAPLMGGHASHVLSQAVADLDAAMDDRVRVLRCGGQLALETFERSRNSLTVTETPQPDSRATAARFDDPYLEWCRRQNLFLHFSPDCIQEDHRVLDAISFKSFSLRLDEDSEKVMNRARDLIDAYNVVKQDYVVARYLTWLYSTELSPIRRHISQINQRTPFSDSLSYATWGVRPGMSAQALKMTVDTWDTIASFVHLYFGSSRRPRQVDFRSFPYADRSGNLEQSFVEALNPPGENRGLTALFDLSSELDKERNLDLSQIAGHRNAATHRFFVVHEMGRHESDEWIERLEWDDLYDKTIRALRITRDAILYLTQMIHINEKAIASPGAMPLPFDEFVPHDDPRYEWKP